MQEYQDSEARRVGAINPVPLACDFIKSTKCGSSLMFERAPWQACASTQRSARSRSCGRAGQAPPSRLLVARGLPGGFHPRWLGLRVARATELVSRFGRAQALASRSAAAPPALIVKATAGVITATVVWRWRSLATNADTQFALGALILNFALGSAPGATRCPGWRHGIVRFRALDSRGCAIA